MDLIVVQEPCKNSRRSARLIAKSTCPLRSKVVAAVTKAYEIYLENGGEIGPGECFGFGLGSFSEKPLGRAHSS